MVTTNVEVIASFKDEVTSKLSSLAKGISGLAKGFSDSINNTKIFGESLSKLGSTMAVGGAIAGATYASYKFLNNVVKEGIQDAIDAQSQWQLMAVNLGNAGIRFSEVRDRMVEATKAAMELGFSDEEAGLSIAKLARQTGDLEKAIRLNNLAMDIARNTGDSLASAQQMLTYIFAGNYRALRQFGIVIKDTATTEEALQIVQNQVANSAKIFGDTYAGKIAKIKVASGELKESIGYALLPIFDNLMAAFGGAGKFSNVVIFAFQEISTAAIGLITMIKLATQAVSTLFSVGSGLVTGGFGKAVDAAKEGSSEMKDTFKDAGDSLRKVWTQSTSNVRDTAVGTFDFVGKEGSDAAKKLADDFRKEMESYQNDVEKMTREFNSSLEELVVAHKDKTNRLKDDMKDENKSYGENVLDMKKRYDEGMADMALSHSRKVEDVQKEIDRETLKGGLANQQRLVDLKIELKREIEDYDLALKRKIEDYDAETKKAKEEHDKRLKDIKSQLDEEKKIQKKYADDFRKFKDSVAVDDITRLKRTFDEQRKQLDAQHAQKVKDFYNQGYKEGSAYGTGFYDGANKKKKSTPEPVKSSTYKAPVISPMFSTPSYSSSDFINNILHPLGFASGGVVSGEIGKPQLAVVHGGEEIRTATNSSVGSNVNLNVYVGVYAGSEVEKRNVAEDLYKGLVQLAGMQNKTVAELLGA